MKNIRQRIKELRKKNDFTQEKPADSFGITYKSVSKWEYGLTTPDLALIVPLSKVLGVSTDELLGAKEDDKRLDEFEKKRNIPATETTAAVRMFLSFSYLEILNETVLQG